LSAIVPLAAQAGQLRLFDTTSVVAGLHLAAPLGALAGPFEPSPTARLGLETSYAHGMRAQGSMSYTALAGTIPVHYLVLASGLDVLLPEGISAAGELSLHYARTLEPGVKPLQLDGGESEFGLEARLAWTRRLTSSLAMRLSVQASMVFTRPAPSYMIWMGTDAVWTTPWHF